MAAAMAAQIFKNVGLTAEVFSAGVSAWPNQPASRHAVSAMAEGGLCLLNHKSMTVSDAMLNEASLVLAMTRQHRATLLLDYPSAAHKIFTIAGYIDSDMDISDPFGGSLEDYRTCAHQLKGLLVKVAKKLGNL